MGFLAPAALALLVLVGLPIAAHLAKRAEQVVVRLPTVRLLERALSEERKQQRLTDPLLFLLRVAIVVAAVSALAAPYRESRVLGDGRPLAVGIVLDDSFSTRAHEDGVELWERERDRAIALVDRLPAGSTASLIGSGEPARVLVPSTDALTLVRDALRSLPPPGARGDDTEEALLLANAQLAGAEPGMRQVVLLTDGRDEALSGIDTSGAPLSIEVVATGVADNTRCVEAHAERDPTSADTWSLTVLAAHAGAPPPGLRASLELDGESAASEPLVGDGDRSRASLRVTVPATTHPLIDVVVASTAPDALPFDDVCGVALDEARAVRVVIIGDERDDAQDGPAAMVARALAVAPPSSGSFSTRVMDTARWLSTPEHEADVIVIDAELRDAPGFLEKLARERELGVGIWWIPRAGRPSATATRLAESLSTRVLGVDELRSTGLTLGDPPVAAVPTADGLERVRVDRRVLLEARAPVALRFDDGAPALVFDAEERVAVLGVPLEDHASDLTLRPGFLALATSLVGSLTDATPLPDRALAAHELPTWAVPRDATQAAIVDRRGQRTSVPIEDGRISLASAREPGAYRVVVTADGRETPLPQATFRVAAPASESVLGAPFEPASESTVGDDDAHVVRAPLDRWVFLLFGILVAAEGFVRLGRRRSAAP